MQTPSPDLLKDPVRNESWRFDLLTLSGDRIGQLDGVTGGSLDFSIHNTIRSGGSLDYDGDPHDWNKVLIRVWYILKDRHGDEYGWPLGTFIPATDTTAHDDTGTTTTLTLYDNLLTLDQDGLDTFYTVPAGKNVVEAIEQTATSGLAYNPGFTGDETTETVRTDRVWSPAEDNTRLRVCNDLAESINYGALDTDGYGRFVSRHLGEASTRSIAWDFRDDEKSIHNIEVTHQLDTANVFNKVIGYVEGDDETPGFAAVATDDNPASPWSYQSRGRWVTGHVEPGEDVSQAVLQAKVDRALSESQKLASSFEISHDVIPLRLNDAVTFRHKNFDIRGVVPTYSVTIDFQGGSEMATTIREVIS